MVEPAAGPVAWLLGFQSPHPGSLCGRGWPSAVLMGLIPFYCMDEKKSKLIDIILVFYIL